MGEGSSYESMMEKLKSGQAGMQRFAVIGIAEKVRRGEAGREALFLCLRYSEAPVIDQTVRELICLAAEEKGKVEFPEVFRELQAALEGSPSHSIETITKAIGYLSRLLFKRSSPHISTIFSPHNNPFIKVFASRVEAHTELLQQVILFVAEVTFTSYADFALFLSPLLTYTAMQISTSTRHTFFFQSLHSHLASLSCTHLSQGLSIFRILVECIQYYPRESTEEIWVTTALAEELVDALKIIMNKSTGKAMEERLCGLELSKYLVSLCNDLSNRGLGSSSVLVLLKHSVEVQMDKDHEYFCDFDSMLITLAHMLATMQYEHEQLLLLNLAIVSLEWKQESGLQLFQNTVADFPVEVLFIFPVIHVMSSPSKTIKKTAISLLQVLQKKLHELLLNPSLITISESTLSDGEKFGMFVHRLVKHIWSQDQGLITWNCDSGLANIWLSKLLGSNNRAKVWLENIQLTFLKGGGGSKRILSSQEKPSKDVVLLLSMVLSGLVLHPKLGSCAIEALTALSRIEQSVGVSYLLVVLFYLNFLHKYGCKSQALVLELLGMLPDLACHSVTVPLILQTVQQMLNEDSPMELRATALRLLCKTWEFSDHVFVHLQKFLHPKLLSSSTLDMDLVISMAACVRDVCKKDPDRGVDLILSVQACIESKKAAVQALGLESLAHLCEFDVVDFYTAWAFISKFLEDPLSDPVVSYSLCVLLRWGAVDAAAYPEASKRVFEILWEVSTVKGMEFSDLWVEARISAIHALTFFEVEYFQQKISEFPGKHVDLLISEHSSKVQNATEGLVIKFLMHEHSTRRKVLRQERVGMNKVEKLLHALPNIIFSPDGKKSVADIPGASLLCLTFSPPPKALAKKVYLKDLQKWQAKYKDALMENAEGIQLSRNIFLALLSLQSWLSFMRCWLRAKIMVFEAEGVCDGLEQITLKAAKSILQDIRSIAEEVVPSTAENLALAIGALCMVLPSSVHNLAPDASEFLLHWLGQDAHEYKQWTSAISLGLLSTCLHITDWKNRYEIIFSLLKTGSIVPVNTIVSVLRCLEKAPRLPSLDWGGLVRCLMRYKDQISANQLSLVPDKHSLHTSGVREECVHFSFVHADHISSLLNFLNELCEISRLKLLEHSLQCVLLLHMVDMIRIFSQTRMQKFFSGIMDFFGRQLNFEVIDHDTEINSRLKTSLKITFWKSLHKCLTDLSLPSLEIYSQSIKNCMQSLFQLLPSLPSNFSEMRNTILLNAEEEWSQAIKCLMDAPKEWLLDILQIEVKDSEEREKYPVAMKKVIFAKARLVANNGMSHSELGKVRSYLLNEKSSDNWRLLMEVAMALRHTTNDVKRKWLLDTIETSCVSKYPSTALRFIGLLTSSWCPYASCLTLDPNSVLQDLPFTCSSLFVDGSWSPLLGTFINKWLNLIERLQNWQSSLDVTAVESIEKDEKQVSSILLEISKQTCIALKDRLPFEVQFKLANITVSES
ncbi:protein RST1 isoform X2 [Cryptomeria japonica]|uniref:protein RST1 isoform X2 n=1 Tax=Cryptomeria japonica TaxID=3369 RepID=UPI0027D9E6C0|nr:protein RST1 isoform X2 [Cryptomeria japonica]